MGAIEEQKALSIARSLAPRDLSILRALYDYKALLTKQIEVLFFASVRRCQDQLRGLSGAGLIEAQRGEWTLTEQGIRVVAITMRRPRSDLDWMPRHAWHDSEDRLIEHQRGVNRFFVSLAAAALEHPGHGLHSWVPERYVRTAQGWIKHDGFGRYLHPEGACDFYLEYDRATEWKAQLVRKLFSYLSVSASWTDNGPASFPNLLVVVPTERRESAFDAALLEVIDSLGIEVGKAATLPFFIASEEMIASSGVLAKVWRRFVPAPPGRPLASLLLAERASIVELPFRDGSPYDLKECFGRRYRNGKAYVRKPSRSRLAIYPSGELPASSGPDDKDAA